MSSLNQDKNQNLKYLQKNEILNEAHIKEFSSKTETKEPDKKLSSPSKRETKPLNNKFETNEPFGSRKNPKLLTSWIPSVIYNKLKNEYSLIFEGKLLKY
jgi:hypothetical protein